MLASGNYLSFFVNWISPMSFALGSIKLTETEKHNLRNHVYRSQGCSILEKYILKDFWNWLTDKFPLWLAPNLITLAGFVVTVAGTLSVLLQDRQGKGEVAINLGHFSFLCLWVTKFVSLCRHLPGLSFFVQ